MGSGSPEPAARLSRSTGALGLLRHERLRADTEAAVAFRADLPRSETGRITKSALRSDGVTTSTWDREAAGLTFERR
jgi:hypothetical protein